MLDALLAWLDTMAADTNHIGVLAVLALSAGIEYVVPPFPGDTVSLLGAVLVGNHDWSFAAVLAATLLGSVIGSMGAFYLGVAVHRRRGRKKKVNPKLDTLIQRFQRHGGVYLCLNRFMPGIRPIFFVAAAFAQMRPQSVLFYSLLSASLWNATLIAAGAALGANLTELESFVQTYSLLIWCGIGMLSLVAAYRYLHKRKRSAPTQDE